MPNDHSSWTPLHNQPPPSVEVLEAWLDSHQVTRHEALQINQMESNQGLRIVSKEDIPVSSVLCSVPKALIFSHRTASFAKICPPPHDPDPEDAQEGPRTTTTNPTTTNPTTNHIILYLTVCLLHELRLGEESVLYGWLQILPREPVLLPTFWGDREIIGDGNGNVDGDMDDGALALDWLRGTEAQKELQRKDGEGLALQDLKSYYSAFVAHLPTTKSQPEPSAITSFLYAFSMVSTRTFVIDTYHTIGMIPYCDLFNHSSSPSKAHSSLLSDPCVCPTCGSLLQCPHDEEVRRESSGAEGGVVVERLAHLPVEYLTKLTADGKEDTVDMRVEREVLAGEEVLSCYEEGVGDGKLLVEWGFVGGEKTGNGLIWSPRDVLDVSVVKTFVSLVREGVLNDIMIGEDNIGILGHPSTSKPGLLNLYPDGRVSINLLVAILLSLHPSDVDMDDLDQVYLLILDVVQDISSDANTSSAERHSVTSEVVQSMLKIFHTRLEQMSHFDLEEIRLIRSTVHGASLQRPAIDVLIQERDLLEKACVAWKMLLDV